MARRRCLGHIVQIEKDETIYYRGYDSKFFRPCSSAIACSRILLKRRWCAVGCKAEGGDKCNLRASVIRIGFREV